MNVRLGLLPIAGVVAITASFLIPAYTYAAVPACTLAASPNPVIPGQGVSLTLTSTGGATAATIDHGVGSVAVNGTRQALSIGAATTFTATVSNVDGSATCSVTVNVNNEGGFAGVPQGSSGGGGGSNPAQTMQGLGQLLGGAGQLLNALGGSNSVNEACLPMVRLDGCGCGRSMGSHGCRSDPSNRQQCVCTNNTNGFVTVGQCMATGRCLGQSSGGGQGALGGGMGGLAGGLQGLGGILQGLGSLMGGGGGGGGGGGAYAGYTGCTQYYYTSTITSDPCAIYQPGTSGQLTDVTTDPNLVSDLLGSLGGSSTPSVSESLTGQNTNQPQVSVTQTQVGSSTSIEQGLTGDVRLNPGATIFANLRDGISEIAGFFGGNTFGGENSQSALSRLCASRPWAGGNFLARLAPDNFFDGLCRAAGYQVGTTQQQTGGQPQTSFTTNEQTPPPPPPVTSGYVEPKAQIRAEPSSVRLGTRTYIFWTSQGVTSCAVRGPNFMQDTLQGAGATVPITGPTTYTINCDASNGASVSDSITVQLAI